MFSQKFEDEVNQRYEKQLAAVPSVKEKVDYLLKTCKKREVAAVKYLYATMPLSDAVDYEPELFLAFAGHALFLQENPLFEMEIPEEIFAEYVLHHRINDESLTECRTFFYEQVAEQVRGRNVEEALIQINLWCASKVTYQSTDERTASPKAVFWAGYGRCGEESTFVVSVLRSVGIPARQIYVPFWSHCDDNHAWVEAWCGGEWHYFGACEPEEILDRGWFTNASARAMMIHSRSFSEAYHSEEIVARDGCCVYLNHLNRYARVVTLNIKVTDLSGSPVSNARVNFEVLNYACHAGIASVESDSRGMVKLTTGLGSLFITAEKNGCYGEIIADTREINVVTLVIGTELEHDIWKDAVIYAPGEDNWADGTGSSATAKEWNEKRKKAAVIRKNREKDFFIQETAAEMLSQRKGEERERVQKLLQKARGNFDVLAGFLKNTESEALARKLELLESLADKDLVDITEEILEDHYKETARFYGKYPDTIFQKLVLCPRVEYEQIHAYRNQLASCLTEQEKERFTEHLQEVWTWLEDKIKPAPLAEYSRLVTSPVNTIRYGCQSQRTKRILCVQIWRTLGIAARLNPAEQLPELWEDGNFYSIEQWASREKITSGIEITAPPGEHWIYFQNWSIEKWENGKYQVLQLCEETGAVITGRIMLHPGRYRINTANRLPNGSVYARIRLFQLNENEIRQITLSRKEARTEDLFVNIRLNDFILSGLDGTSFPVSWLVRDRIGVFLWLKAGEEPTEHILNEMIQRKEAFKESAADLYFILRSVRDMENDTLQKALHTVPGTKLVIDQNEEDRIRLARKMYLDPDTFPMVVMADQVMTGIYASAGYNVGMAEMVLKLLQIKHMS